MTRFASTICASPAPDSSLRLSEAHVELKPGERTLIVGERGASRALLLRAIIGIWPWGRGRITRPPRQSMMFLPKSAYVPPGTLRAALAYPHRIGRLRRGGRHEVR